MAGLGQERDLIGFGTVRGAPEESIDHFVAQFGRREPEAEREDVGIIPFAGASSRLGIYAQCSPRTGDFVGRHSHACPRKTASDPDISPPRCDRIPHRLTGLRPAQRVCDHKDFVAEPREIVLELLCHGGAFIGAERNPHGLTLATGGTRRLPSIGPRETVEASAL